VTVTEPGLLRVESVPPVPTRISVNGVVRDRFGLDWVKFAPGPVEVCFSDVEGFATPPCVNTEVIAGETTTVVAPFDELGFLKVATDPPVDATISVDGVPRDNWGIWQEFTPGPHEVCFGPAADLLAPPCRTVEVVAGQTTDVTVAYTPVAGEPGTPAVGYLAVANDMSPADILVDAIPRDSRHLDGLALAPGLHEVCFGDATGFGTPACQTIEVVAGELTAVGPELLELGLLHVIIDPRLPSTIALDAVPRDDYGLDLEIEPGFFEVCAGPVAGYRLEPDGCQPAFVPSTAENGGEPTVVTFTFVTDG
jgi:hypothetical protein